METDEVCDRPLHPFAPLRHTSNPHRKIKPQNAPHPANAADEVRFFCQKVSTEKGRRTRRYTTP